MNQKVSRKDLKQPDEFISITQRVFQWMVQQKYALLIGVCMLVAAILGAYGWRWYVTSKEMDASRDFIKAYKTLEEGQPSGFAQVQSVPSEDKLKSALGEFEKVKKDSPSDSTSTLATYYVGNLNYRLGNYDKAIENLKEYLARDGEKGVLAAFAVEGIAASLEAQGKDEDAKAQYQRLTKPPYDLEPDRGLYHLARLDQKTGKFTEASKTFKEILEKYPNTLFVQEIQNRLSSLPRDEAKTAEAPAGNAVKAANP